MYLWSKDGRWTLRNGGFQTNESRNLKMNDNILKKSHAQRVFWRANNKNALCWAFYCVNDNKKIDVLILQTMRCILCHNNSILNVIQKLKLGNYI
jgi:cytochrome c oxidase assembly protein Cox11